MVKVGEHITLDFLGIPKVYTPIFFKELVYKIAKETNVEILNVSQYEFKPFGFTLLALLAESHMSFHTFPEHNIISFDFFTCGKVSPAVALDIIKKEIEHKRVVVRQFARSTVSLYKDINNTPGRKSYYVVNNVLEDFVSKENQHIEILELEEFGKSLFIDNDLQVTEKDEHLYSGTMVGLASKKVNSNELEVTDTVTFSGTTNTAVIGGGDGGVVRECISKGFNSIDWFELDSEVVAVCDKHLAKIGNKDNMLVNCIWGDAFKSITFIEDCKYDKIFIDLNDDQHCIDLAIKNIDNLKRILKPDGVIITQVGSQDEKPKQVDKWLDIFSENFVNVEIKEIYIPSFDCNGNVTSAYMKK